MWTSQWSQESKSRPHGALAKAELRLVEECPASQVSIGFVALSDNKPDVLRSLAIVQPECVGTCA